MLVVHQKTLIVRSKLTSHLISRCSDFLRRHSHSQPLVEPPSSTYSSIQIVDLDTWIISSPLSHSRSSGTLIPSPIPTPPPPPPPQIHAVHLPDLDEIDDMKIRGNLFFKMLKNSKEYEESRLRFKGNINPKKKKNKIEGRNRDDTKDVKKSEESVDVDDIPAVKRIIRPPSFNKLTAPYHFPFCLDIFTSKKSVRACVVHRVTNKVVVVAHSISKDLKHDLESRRGFEARVTVGAVLAQRALADDIYSVVYTPKEGEIIEGRIRDVIRSIVDNGVNVEIKLKRKMDSKNEPLF